MDYLTQERRLLQQSARDFAMKEVLPIANKLYPERGEIPAGIRNKLAELGYFDMMIPEEYGGLGLGAFEYCLLTEELARAWMSVDTIIRNSLVSAAVECRTGLQPALYPGVMIGSLASSQYLWFSHK